MEYVTLTLPVQTYEEFKIIKPNNWDKLSDTEKYDFFMKNMSSNSLHEVDYDYLETYTVEEFIAEHLIEE
jgi:hypothetical protein